MLGILLTVFGTCGAVAGWILALLGYVGSFLAGQFFEGVIVSSVLTIPAVLCTAAAIAGGFFKAQEQTL